MKTKTDQTSVAWGLDLDDKEPRLVRVTRKADGFRFEQHSSASAQSADPKAQLDVEPLAVCIGNQCVLHRTLDLPQAEDSTVAKMVEAQLEVLLPARSQLFAWDWDDAPSRSDGPGRSVWVCAARQDAVEQARRSAEAAGRRPRGVVPTSVAMAAAVPRLIKDLPTRCAVVDVANSCTTVLVLDDGELAGCAVIEPQDDQWAGQLREAYESQVSHLPRDQRPGKCVLIQRSADAPDLTELVTQSLKLETIPASLPKGLAPSDMAAAGAAMTLIEPAHPAIALAETEESATEVRQDAVKRRSATPRRALVALWLVAVIITMYLADRHEANWLNDAIAKINPAVAGRGGFTRQIAMGRYLEKIGAAPLDVLDEISSLTSNEIIFSSFQYSHVEGVRLSGTAPSTDKLHELLKILADAETLEAVELKGQKMDKKKCLFEIAAKLSDRYVPGVKRKARDKDEDKDKKKEKDQGEKKPESDEAKKPPEAAEQSAEDAKEQPAPPAKPGDTPQDVAPADAAKPVEPPPDSKKPGSAKSQPVRPTAILPGGES